MTRRFHRQLRAIAFATPSPWLAMAFVGVMVAGFSTARCETKETAVKEQRSQVRCNFLIVQTTEQEWHNFAPNLEAWTGTNLPPKCEVRLAKIADVKEALHRQFQGKILSAPSLITRSDRQAQIKIGTEISVHIPNGKSGFRKSTVDAGLSIKVRPKVMEGGRIQVGFEFRNAEVDPERTVEIDGQKIPGLMVASLSTSWNMKAGDGVVLAIRTKHVDGDKLTLVVMEPLILPAAE